jgi:hypothetical protein
LKKEKMLANFYEKAACRTPKLISAGTTKEDGGWPNRLKLPTGHVSYADFGIFFTLQLLNLMGLLFSNIFRWFVALVVISYVVVTAVRSYDQLELLAHQSTILRNNPPFSETGASAK